MTDRKFTPGPWEVSFTECGLGNIAQRKFTVRGDGHSVAGCYCTNPKRNAENDANGYLCAAAPEMYECICDALTDLKMSGGMRAHFEEVLKKARGEE